VQQQRESTSISIRAARDWQLLLFAFLLLFWVVVPLSIVLDPGGGTGTAADLPYFEVGWLLADCFFAWRIAWGFGGMESIVLSATELRLSSTLFGLSIRRRVVPTSEVRNLRFLPSSGSGRSYTRSKITYEDGRGMVRLAAGLDEWEALILINLMLTVYPFPKVKSRYTTP
jgi:hypothetical protein